jgi:hypothetical protein
MRPGLQEPVSVLAGYSQKYKTFKPLIVTWQGIDYRLGKTDYYHKSKKGVTTLHHFSLADKDEGVYFKLTLDGTALKWTLDEYQYAADSQVVYS